MTDSPTLPARVAKWDNIKGFLIFLVVLGHAIIPMIGNSEFFRSLFIWLNAFHMPLFLFISGLFSKKTINAPKLNTSKIITYVLIFFFMKITVYFSVLFSRGYAYFTFLTESGTPWYIFVSAVFILITYAIKKFNPKKVLLIIIALSLSAGFVSEIDNTMMLSRTIVFYPYFYVGYIADKDKILDFVNHKSVRVFSFVCFALFTGTVLILGYKIYDIRYFLTGSVPYAKIPDTLRMFAPLLRLTLYAFSGFISFCIISFFPNRRIPLLTHVGVHTLPVYALHRQVIYFFQFSALPLWLSGIPEFYSFLLLFAASAALTLILSLKPFDYALYPCTHYKKWATPLSKWFAK